MAKLKSADDKDFVVEDAPTSATTDGDIERHANGSEVNGSYTSRDDNNERKERDMKGNAAVAHSKTTAFHQSNSSSASSSSEKISALTDDLPVIGNLNVELKNYHESDSSNRCTPTRDANDDVQQPSNHVLMEQHQYVEGVVDYDEGVSNSIEGDVVSDDENKVQWTSISEGSESPPKLEDKNISIGQSVVMSDTGTTAIIEGKATSDNLKRVRWTTTLEEVMAPSATTEAENVIDHGIAEQWIRKMIQEIVVRCCFCKGMRQV